MANSLIDDMFAENSQFSNNGGIKSPKNGSKKVLLIGLAIIIVVALVALIFFMGKMKKPDIKLSAKGDFIKYLSTASPTSWIDMTSLEEKFELLKANSSESKTTITVASNMEELSLLTGAELTIDTEYDANNHRGLLDFDFEYMKNKLFNMQTLITGEKIAVKADEIVVKYVGYKLENVINVVTDFSEETEDVSGNSIGVQNIVGNVIEKIKKIDYIYIFDSLNAEFMQSESAKYAQVLNSIEDAKFTQKEVTLERDTGNVNSIAYTLTLNEQDIMNLFAALLEEIKNDTEMISIFTTALEPTGLGITDEQVKVYIDNLISSTYEYEADTSKTVKVTMFVVNGQVVKYTMDFDTLVAEIDFYDYGSEAKSVFTLLDKENSSGISFNLIRNVGEISEIYTLELNLITNNEVVNKATMFAEFENSNKANEMAIKCGITYTDKTIELSVNADTKVKFTDVEVEDLTSENCLFIDELNEEEKRVNIKAIKDRTAQIFNEKVEKIFLINTNVNSSIIEGIDSDEEIEAALKQAAQEKLINAVANEMYLAQEEGETYTVEDIADLEIEDVELEIVVENEIATVKIDGFTFQIDASFALSEVTTETE